MRRLIVLLPLLLSPSLWMMGAQDAQPVPIALVASTSLKKELPFAVLQGQRWEAEDDSRFVKLHLYFDEPIDLKRYSITACSPLTDGIASFINFDGWTVPMKTEGKEAFYELAKPDSARSLTFNFQNNMKVCIEKISITSASKGVLTFVPPDVMAGNAVATSTLKPDASYDVMNLFDSRIEYGWASSGKASGDTITFTFAKEVRIEKLRVWNGYQRSEEHCQANSRAKNIKLEGDGGFSHKGVLADEMSHQDIVFAKPFKGKKLVLKFEDAYKGKAYNDLVLSELRFHNGKNWFILDPRPAMARIQNQNTASFKNGGVDFILNHNLEMAAEGSADNRWVVRFRRDGSFYLEGGWANEGTFENYYALGNYEVKAVRPGEADVRVFGFLRRSRGQMMDCNGCGRDCNKPKPDPNAPFGKTEEIFEDTLTLKKTKAGVDMINTGKAKRITFDRLQLKVQ